MNVLVVDDELDFVEALREFLELCNHSVTTAINGQDGLEKFIVNPQTFDVIITDINMPLISGIDMVLEVNCLNYDIPVVFISGEDNIEKYQEISELKSCEWLKKPFDFEDLENVLEQVAAKKEPV